MSDLLALAGVVGGLIIGALLSIAFRRWRERRWWRRQWQILAIRDSERIARITNDHFLRDEPTE